ncbi:MAG: hypothetical protein KDD50_09465, partial [Bdellovibrionales bacterium]|nr:hypothetical protein [Bdellovibrionales bacterium]
MTLLDFFKDGENSPQTQRVIKSSFLNTISQIGSKSQFSTMTTVGLFFITLWATPIYQKYPKLLVQYSVLLVLNAIILFLLSDQKKKIESNKIWALTYMLLSFVFSALWGILCAWALYSFNLSWTSFFITLITLAVASTYSVVYAPHMIFFQLQLLLTLLPTVIVTLYTL